MSIATEVWTVEREGNLVAPFQIELTWVHIKDQGKIKKDMDRERKSKKTSSLRGGRIARVGEKGEGGLTRSETGKNQTANNGKQKGSIHTGDSRTKG